MLVRADDRRAAAPESPPPPATRRRGRRGAARGAAGAGDRDPRLRALRRPEEAAAWLATTLRPPRRPATDAVVDAGIALVNDALHAHAVAAADPYVAAVTAGARGRGADRLRQRRRDRRGRLHARPARSTSGRPAPRAGAAARRTCAHRNGSPPCCAAASALAACEPLLLRARADLDAGRRREAALQLRVGLEALLAELPGALDDDEPPPRHRLPGGAPGGGRGRRRAGPRRRPRPRGRGHGPRRPGDRPSGSCADAASSAATNRGRPSAAARRHRSTPRRQGPARRSRQEVRYCG